MTRGFKHGATVALGIVAGDLVFLALAILGMTFLAETLGSFFLVLRYAAGLYLIMSGIKLLRTSRTRMTVSPADSRFSFATSFTAGFLLTLSDIKAIVFYASLLPVFVDLTTLAPQGMIMLGLISGLSVGSVKIGYAYAANRIARRLDQPRYARATRYAAGGIMLGAGSYILLKSS